MKWLGEILAKRDQKPAPLPQGRAEPPRPAPVPEARLREMRATLEAAAGDADEIEKRQRELGRVLGESLCAPEPGDGPAVWVEAICCAPDKALALDWCAAVQGERWLAEAAIRSRYGEVRLAAARRMQDEELLAQVAEASRDRDKRVSRHCSDLLKERQETRTRAQRAAELARALNELLGTRPIPDPRLAELHRSLVDLGETGEDLAECRELMSRAQARAQEETRALRELQSRLEDAEALRADAASAHPSAESQQVWRERLAALADARTAGPEWLAEHPASRALQAALVAVEARLAEIDTEFARAAEEQARAAELAAKAAEAALAAASAPPPPATEPRPKRERPKLDLDALRALAQRMDLALEQGQLHEAEAADAEINAQAGDADLPGSLARRLRRGRAQIARLRGWERWGTHEAREHLIEAAEELLQNEHDADELSRAVPALREEWKRLEAHGHAGKGQWERFDAALTKAWQPVQEKRAEEAARHEEAYAARSALLDEWESWLAGMAWEHADFKAVEARRQQVTQQWRAAPRAGFKHERKLARRMDALLGAIDAQIKQAREQETARRQQIVAAAEVLRESVDIGSAIAEAKSLQKRWQSEAGSVRLNRGEEQKLWKRFRAACDAIFSRRDAERAERDAARKQRDDARKSQLDALEAAIAGTDIGQVEKALAEFRAQWAGAARPRKGPRDSREARDHRDPLDARAQQLMELAAARGDSLRRERHVARFAVLAEKSALAARAEAAAAAGVGAEEALAEVRRQWEALAHLPGKWERALGERLAQAVAATAQSLAEGREARDAMLLDLEIALGLPSPEGLEGARRARQLEQLQKRFGGEAAESRDPEALVVLWHATPAPADADQEQRMAAAVAKLQLKGGRASEA